MNLLILALKKSERTNHIEMALLGLMVLTLRLLSEI